MSRGGGPPKAVEGWLRCRERYRCDRRQDVLLLIRSDRAVRNVSTPQSRLRRASPPWQGGPRGLSNFATKCNLLPLLQEEARGSALLQPTATIPTKSSIHQPNFDASESQRTRTTTGRVQRPPKAEYPIEASAHKQGVQGGTPWAFSVPFCAQKGTPAREGARPARTPRRALP